MYFAHRYDEAIDQLSKAVDLDPGYWLAHLCLGLAYEGKGDLPRAVAEFQKAREMESSISWPLAELGHAYALSGKKSEAEQAIKELQDLSSGSYVPACYSATVCAGLGQKEQGIASLEKAFADRSCFITFINVDPKLDSVRSDPRFADLVRRVGLR